MKRSFLNIGDNVLTCMVQADTPDRVKELITLARAEGAEAFGMQLCRMKPEYRNREVYEELFSFASIEPVYVTNYRLHFNEGKSDDTLASELIEYAECGATLCDVIGDLFAPCKGELTTDNEAIKKQMKLIDEIHARDKEVLMSSHVCEFTPAERVLEIALEHKRRGADIAKIVTGASTEEEEIENIRIVNLLKKELGIPFLFLACGNCRIHRRIGGTVGSCMSLCVYEHDKFATKEQPLLRDMRALKSLL